MKNFLLIVVIVGLLIVACDTGESIDTPKQTPTLSPTRSEQPTESPVSGESLTPTEEPSASVTTISVRESLEVHFIDVGQGDAILVDLAETEVLIDGGGKSPEVTEYLRDYVDGALELIVATHPHADHIGGLIEVLEQFEVNEVWHNGDTHTSKTYQQFMEAIEAEGAEVHTASLHDVIEAGELSFYVHHPAAIVESINNNSIVLHLQYGEIDFLFTGDAEIEAEAEMIEKGNVPDIDVLKVGHHGSRTASSLEFLQITNPEVAVYMAGEGNTYGHPHEETLTKLVEIGAEIYGTLLNGTIVVSTDGVRYGIVTQRSTPIDDNGKVPTDSPTPTDNSEIVITDPPPGVANVQITHIHYDGAVYRVESDEYVQITNLGTASQNLSGWTLKDISEGYPSLTFSSYVLAPNESIRVYTNEYHPEWGGFSFDSGKAVWNNSSPDTAVLRDSSGQEISRKSY